MKIILYTIVILTGTFAITFGLNAMGLFNLKFWGVKFQDAQTEIFEETKAYKHGTIRDIENLCLEMNRAETQAHKNALRTTIRHRLSAFNYDDLPAHVRRCASN